jgi:hypothetical protein
MCYKYFSSLLKRIKYSIIVHSAQNIIITFYLVCTLRPYPRLPILRPYRAPSLYAYTHILFLFFEQFVNA